MIPLVARVDIKECPLLAKADMRRRPINVRFRGVKRTSIKMNDAATQVSSFEAAPERQAFF
jgi:hypothetical protein